jgi:hypothetical protein
VAPSGALIVGGRWDGRCDRAPDAWRHRAFPRRWHGL